MKTEAQTKLYKDLREHLLHSDIMDVIQIMKDIHNKEARGETLSEEEYYSAEIIDRIMSNFHWEMGKMDDMPLKEFKFFGEK